MIRSRRACNLAARTFIVGGMIGLALGRPMAAKADSDAPVQDRQRGSRESVSAEAAPPRMLLCGTVVYADGAPASAWVRVEGSEALARVGVGQQVLGWTVTQITERQVVLSLDDRSATFPLNYAVNQSERQPFTQPTAIARPNDEQRPAPHQRLHRVFERNAAGILRSHLVKNSSADDN